MLDLFRDKQTRWQGLWEHEEINGFTSASISLAQLKKYKGNIRLVVVKNKFYGKGKNGRPKYVFTIADSQTDAEELEVVETNKGRMYTEEEVWAVIHGMQNFHHLPPGDDLIEDFI